MLLLSLIGPLTNVPAGTSTVPPPAALAWSMTFWIAAVLNDLPSPAAPCSVMLKAWFGMAGSAGAAAASGVARGAFVFHFAPVVPAFGLDVITHIAVDESHARIRPPRTAKVGHRRPL